MDETLFTIIYSYRDRDIQRVKRSLDSLNKQTFNKFKVIFVDNGSNRYFSGDINKLIQSYSFCQYIYIDTRGYPWNKAKALNVGIKATSSKYIIINDVDIIFPNDHIQKLDSFIKEDTIVFFYTYFLGKDFSDWDSIEKYRNKLIRGSQDACGIHCVSTKLLKEIGGFDEYYEFWGVEDRDIRHRYSLCGLKEVWDDNLYQYHQWHPVANNSDKTMPYGVWDSNQKHYFLNYNTIKRNTDIPWGMKIGNGDRPVFRYLDFYKKSLKIDEHVYFYKTDVFYSKSGGNFIEYFAALPKGSCVVVCDTFFIQPQPWCISIFIRILNKLMKTMWKSVQIDFARNYLISFLVRLVRENPEIFVDYYFNFESSEYGSVSLFIKN